MKVRHLLAAMALLLSTGASAQEKAPTWINHVKLSGYGMVQYQASDKTDAKANSFNLRLARISLDGRILNDFYWKAQIQINGNTSQLGSSPRVVDLFAEWQKYTYFRVKAGQFKRPFTFENPMHPIEQGFMGYSQIINNIAGFTDRAGGHSSNGRDIGVQLQGDLLPIANHSRHLIHYQVGLWTGNGINHADNNSHKDLIGGIYLMPLKGLKVGAWGWNGRYTSSTNVTVDRKRWAAGFAYDGLFIARGEYAHSYGYKVSDYVAETNSWKNSGKSEGWYVMAGAPVTRDKKLRIFAKVDSYSDYLHLDYSTTKNIYGLTAEYWFMKNLKLQLNANTINDKATSHKGGDGK